MITPWISYKKNPEGLKGRLVKLKIEILKTEKNLIVSLVICHHKKVIETIMKLFQSIKFSIKGKLVLIVSIESTIY